MNYKDMNAIDKVKQMVTDGKVSQEVAEEYFPELAEVKDEDIKRWVINEIKIKHHALDEDEVDFVDKAIKWLEKQGTKNTAWTEHDECCKNQLLIFCEHCMVQDSNTKTCANWLKEIKNRVGCEANCTTTKEWSEQDEYNKRLICRNLRAAGCRQYVQDKINSWLETFKFQSHWKPSKEQIKALEEASNEHWEPDGLDPLYTLLQDLKKLMEA